VDYKTFVKHYSTDYLYLTPEQFSFSHLPKDESQQFLANPKSAETFVKEPFVPGTFFSYGLSFGKSAPDYSNEISESAKYDFKISRSNTLLASALSSAEQEIQCASWTDRIGAAATAEFDVPDSKNYSAKILARQKGEIKNPFFFSAAEFEGEVIPPAQNLLAQKKISQKEFDFLTASYFAENGRYYFAENLFDSARNNAVTKILKLLGKNTSVFDTVLSFEIKSSAEYKGYGTEKFRFPYGYGGFFETQNTHLISPVCGVLKKSQSYLFSMNTKDFVSAGILYNDEIVPFQKNSKSGNLELEFSVPDDVDRISVFGSKNGKNFAGLYFYTVE
jgi:hypothetical protein